MSLQTDNEIIEALAGENGFGLTVTVQIWRAQRELLAMALHQEHSAAVYEGEVRNTYLERAEAIMRGELP